MVPELFAYCFVELLLKPDGSGGRTLEKFLAI